MKWEDDHEWRRSMEMDREDRGGIPKVRMGWGLYSGGPVTWVSSESKSQTVGTQSAARHPLLQRFLKLPCNASLIVPDIKKNTDLFLNQKYHKTRLTKKV
jgi:hypothetical protein